MSFWGLPAPGVPKAKIGVEKESQSGNFNCFSINSVQTRCILKTVDLQGVFVKIGDFNLIKFEGFIVEFIENRRARENPRPPPPRKSPEKWTFLSLAFYNAPSLHIVDSIFQLFFSGSRFDPQPQRPRGPGD